MEFHGVIPAIFTAFNADETLDIGALYALVDKLVGDGVHGVFVVGSQGEYYALDAAEKRLAMKGAVRAASRRVPVFAGTGANTNREAVELTRFAEAVGADAVSVLTPSYIAPGQEELYQRFHDVAASTRSPVLLYSSPGRTGVNVSASLVARLARIDNIVGIKDSSGDLSVTAAYIAAAPPGFRVFARCGTLLFATLQHGGIGVVSACGNVVARHLVQFYAACKACDIESARSIQQELAPLREVFSLGTFPAAIYQGGATHDWPGCGPLP